jgi:predicted negative regulator of RcsB-dependent stress response
MDDQRINRGGGPMRFRWFRFSVKSLLGLVLLVAAVCLGWRVYRSGQHARLVRQVEIAQRARNIALENWKLAASNHVTGRIDTANKEAAYRGQYFAYRNAVENALKRLSRYEARTTK